MIKIAELYPDNIMRTTIIDEDDNKWSAALNYYNDDGNIGEVIYSFDEYIYDSSEEAMDAMNKFVNVVLKTVKVMSN